MSMYIGKNEMYDETRHEMKIDEKGNGWRSDEKRESPSWRWASSSQQKGWVTKEKVLD